MDHFDGFLTTVPYFLSACVMNLISYEKAYCLYPRATVHEHLSLVTTLRPSRGHPAALAKYESRGFGILSSESLLPHDPDFPLGTRYIGDRQCWTLPLNLEGVEVSWPVNGASAPLTQDPVAATSWRLHEHRRGTVISSHIEASHFLYHTYACASWEAAHFVQQILFQEYGLNMSSYAPRYGSNAQERR